MYKLVLEKAEKPDIKLSTSIGSQKKQGNFQKQTSASASLTVLKPLTMWITTNWKILKQMEISGHLTCLLRNLYAQVELDMEQQTGSKLGKKYDRMYIVTLLA